MSELIVLVLKVAVIISIISAWESFTSRRRIKAEAKWAARVVSVLDYGAELSASEIVERAGMPPMPIGRVSFQLLCLSEDGILKNREGLDEHGEPVLLYSVRKSHLRWRGR